MSSRSRRLVKLLVPALSPVRAVVEWSLTPPKGRRRLSAMGIYTMGAYVDVRVGLVLPVNEDFRAWLHAYGFGLVKEPSDIYKFMQPLVDDLPEYEMISQYVNNPRVQSSNDCLTLPGMETVGFLTKKLPSGARFYYAPFAQDSTQGRAWLSITAQHMGYDLSRS